MTPMGMFGLGTPELLIILALALLIFGGTRLAGLGKSSGRAIREFKEETKSLSKEKAEKAEDPKDGGAATQNEPEALERNVDRSERIEDAEIVEPEVHNAESPKNDLR